MIDTGHTTFTLTGARKALAEGQLSAVELLRSVYEQLERTEPVIHAFVDVYANEALAQAIVADRRRPVSHPTPHLLGIPIAVKDIFDIAGKPTPVSYTHLTLPTILRV